MSNVRLSVVIPVYNNWWLTARCLRSLEQLRDSCSFAFETILVDNASSDETPQAVARFGWVRYVRHDENRNFAGACNAGTRFAQAPVTLLLNNDAYPLGDALTPLVAAFEREEVAIAGGALFFEDGVTQAAGLVVLRNAHWHYSCRNLPPSLEAVTTFPVRPWPCAPIGLCVAVASTSRTSMDSKTSTSAYGLAKKAGRLRT
jgi:GT2 family glycosyltransferase